MAAFAALSIDNVIVELDGLRRRSWMVRPSRSSTSSIVSGCASRTPHGTPSRSSNRSRCARATSGRRSAPSDGFELAFELRYATRAIGTQRIDLCVDEYSFRRELAAARTFGFLHEIEALKAMGLAKGASLDNAIGLDGDRILNPEGLRMEREFVRHKALDAVGDLYTLGAPLIGRFESVKGGHALNNALCRALLAQPSAWRWRPPELDLEMALVG